MVDEAPIKARSSCTVFVSWSGTEAERFSASDNKICNRVLRFSQQLSVNGKNYCVTKKP